MAYKYVNPGYGTLLDSNPGSNTTSSRCKTGLCFSQTTRGNNILFPDGLKEVWVKFWTYQADTVRAYFDDDNCTGFRLGGTNASVWVNNNQVASFTVANQRDGKEHNFILHIKSDATDGILEIYSDGTRYHQSGGNVFGGNDVKHFELQSDYSNNYFSGIIIADYDISKEEIAVLPIADTTLEGFEKNGDNYLATAEDAVIKQKIDAETLVSNIGQKSLIKSLSIYSVPCYANDDTLSKIATFVEEGEKSVEGETKDLPKLSESTNASNHAIYSAPMSVNPVTGKAWTLDELGDVFLGLKTVK